jgi:adenosine kinase
MSKILVSGSIAYDRIMDYAGLFAEHIMPEKLHAINLSFQVDTLSVQFGGCAGNIAYNLALLGEEPQILATAGSDFGGYRAHLLSSGVDPSSIRILENDFTSSAYILTDKADNQIAAFHGGAGNSGYDTVVETEGRALAIVAPGSVPDMRDLPAHYRKHNLGYLYDPAQQIPALTPEMLKDGITGALGLFGSDYEYALIQQKTGWSEVEILQHTPMVIVTYGAKGSDVITAQGKKHADVCPAQALVDPTGAGDAYRAGFVKGLILGLPPEICARVGSVAAAYVVEVYGTQTHRYTKEEFAHRYQKTYGETLAL